MNLRKNGMSLKLATKDKRWWFKLSIAIILSNILFFLFFHENEVQGADMIRHPDDVEIRIQADLFTSFSAGKKILIINREGRISRPGILIAEHIDEEIKSYTIQVDQKYVNELLNTSSLQILPYIREITFKPSPKRYDYEIRY